MDCEPSSVEASPLLHCGEASFDSPSRRDDHLVYIFPALLGEVDRTSYGVPRYAPSGLLRLEKQFQLPRFAPMSLVPQIIAKLFSQRRSSISMSMTTQSLSHAEQDKYQCFRTCFVQTFGERTVWVFLDDQAPSSSGGLSSDSCEMQTPSKAARSRHLYAPTEKGWRLRIILFEYLFNVQGAVQELAVYEDIIWEVLLKYRGLGHVSVRSLCPFCLMRQVDDEDCGAITEDLELLAVEDLKDIANKHQDKLHLQEALKRWEASYSRLCPKGCPFKADFYLPFPAQLLSFCAGEEDIERFLYRAFITPEEVQRSQAEVAEAIAPGIVRVSPIHLDPRYVPLVQKYVSQDVKEQLSVRCRKAGDDVSGVCLRYGTDMLVLTIHPEAPTEDSYFIIHVPAQGPFLCKPMERVAFSHAMLLEIVAPLVIQEQTIPHVQTIKLQPLAQLRCPSVGLHISKKELCIESAVIAYTLPMEVNSVWGRVVRRVVGKGQYDYKYLVNAYASNPQLAGAPVFLAHSDEVVGVVSSASYMENMKDVFLIAPISAFFRWES